MSFDAFVNIDGIEGESTDDKHPGWIEIQSFGAGHSQRPSETASNAGGASTGRVDFHDFSFEKLLDKATPKLALACADGSHINTIRVELCRAGTEKINIWKLS
jgi:type VI secretion system secreted protein Hcp